MKKALALIAALVMTCAMITGCSEDSSSTAGTTSSSSSSAASSEADTSSSSEAETTTTASSSTPDDTTTTASSSEPDATTTTKSTESSGTETAPQGGSGIKFEDSYTGKFQKQTASKAFTLNMSMKYMGVDMPIDFEVNGDEFHLKMSAAAGGQSMVQEYYCVGGYTYVLDSTKKTYNKYKGAATSSTSVTNLVPEGTYELVSQKEENGKIVEVVNVTTTNSAGKKTTSQATYRYDKATGLPSDMDVTASGVKTTVTVTKFDPNAPTIKLPDLSGWTEKGKTATN